MSRPAPFDAELEEAQIDYRLWKNKGPITGEKALKLVPHIEHYLPLVSRTERTLKFVRLLLSAHEGIDSPWVERSFRELRRDSTA